MLNLYWKGVKNACFAIVVMCTLVGAIFIVVEAITFAPLWSLGVFVLLIPLAYMYD